MNPIQGKRILLGVTGSIACYKAADLASKLTQAGAQVDTILTKAATQFITPLTFQAVTGRRAYTDGDLWGHDAHVLHIGLAHQADLLVIAPATANTLAQLAQGSADSLLNLTALAATCPRLLAPAMDGGMYTHPATQANLQLLAERGARIVGPEEGHLASGLVARGRMTEPLAILGHIRQLFAQSGALRGRRVVVTAGGTREPLDPVRFLSNHSSGKQGYAVAQAALDLGAEVVLITTTTALPTPSGAQPVLVNTAAEMLDAVQQACQAAEVLIMAAAVADFRPAQVATQKIKKQTGAPTIELTPNPDILATLAQQRPLHDRPLVVVGFAAETENLATNAQVKLQKKGLDFIVANDVSAPDAGFAVDTNRVTLLGADGTVEILPLLSKTEVAEQILQRVVKLLNNATAKPKLP
ncbi:MAG: bifunctional phosphopantothenoylcysteine decarboxylase/phosphopantothenate--cysteine ligase CoaBC [Chloroflexi bacterium]|nr:bifunctional phosphopantothenoylcysteine decarboxylase/phosphopantothenate--cysteine ligase CoaBC [Chloroflexota bacterium]